MSLSSTFLNYWIQFNFIDTDSQTSDRGKGVGGNPFNAKKTNGEGGGQIRQTQERKT